MGSVASFASGRACSDALFHVIDRAFDPAATDGERRFEERASVSFAGGILQQGFQCGMLWGAALAAGAQAYRTHGKGPQAETAAIVAAQGLVESFRSCNGCINCSDLTQPDLKSSMQVFKYFLLKGGAVGCFRRAGRFGPRAYAEVQSSLGRPIGAASPGPASCAAVLLRKMGASDLHVVMAAGLAGGIGLSGGGCGALGAAIWVIAMDALNAGGDAWGSRAFRARTDDLINRFLRCSSYEFECSAIVGREFESPDDHADYLEQGGCAQIIDVLAASGSQ